MMINLILREMIGIGKWSDLTNIVPLEDSGTIRVRQGDTRPSLCCPTWGVEDVCAVADNLQTCSCCTHYRVHTHCHLSKIIYGK